MAKIFISYRHVEPDQTIAKFLHRYLTDRDHEVFFDSADLSVGMFWHKKIRAKVEEAEYFIPLISLAYLNSDYILKNELSPAARLLELGKLRAIMQVNLAFDGIPPDVVSRVVTQIQFLKWRRSDDTLKVAEDLASRIPSPRRLVKGMRSFTATDAPVFEHLGRAHQILQFSDLLWQPSNRHILLHGVSGSGKTSFLKAGVLPKLAPLSVLIVELEHETVDELDSVLLRPDASTKLCKRVLNK